MWGCVYPTHLQIYDQKFQCFFKQKLELYFFFKPLLVTDRNWSYQLLESRRQISEQDQNGSSKVDKL